MELKSVKKYSTKYPDKYQVDLDHLLLLNKPNRWKRSTAATLLICALTAGQLAGCSGNVSSGQSKSRKMNMAPIFKGERNGEDDYRQSAIPTFSTMSLKTQTPVFRKLGNYPMIVSGLSEEEALAIIREQLKYEGIESNITNKEVAIKDTSSKWTFDLEIKGGKEPIYVEFLPGEYQETEDEKKEQLEIEALKLSTSSLKSATELREKLCDVEDESTGVIFYGAKETDYDLFLSDGYDLYSQVGEFVEWLKTSGLI